MNTSVSAGIVLICCVLVASALMVGLIGRGDDTRASGSASERQEERREMVETQLRGVGRTTITDTKVLDAMLRIPRHRFVPDKYRALAYSDSPVPIGYGQTISQPYIVALMTQALALEPGMKVLEVGTGSGYQAAILAEITKNVFTMEILTPLCESARQRLREQGYDTIKVACADGYHGWPEYAPFDRIIVTAAALHVPPQLFDQLKADGKMIIPVGGAFETQRLLLLSKDTDGGRKSVTLSLVRFVPLIRGEHRDK